MSEIARTQIGTSGIEIAALSLGTNVFGWTADAHASYEVLDAFTEAGGNFIDTADGYSHWVPGNGGGDSEKIIGEWQATRGVRDDIVLATKVSTHPDYQGLSASNVRAAVDASLQRLQTDYIDLYYAHFDDPDTPLAETVEVFSQLVDSGKVRAIGVSNYTSDRVNEWFEIARAGSYHLPVALQPLYSLVERDFETNGLRDVAAREKLAVFPYYALARGFLAGKYREASDGEGGSPRAGAAIQYLDERGRAVLAALDEVAEGHNVQVATVALAWLRQQETVAAPIASARNLAQVPPLLASLTMNLSEVELEILDRASSSQ